MHRNFVFPYVLLKLFQTFQDPEISVFLVFSRDSDLKLLMYQKPNFLRAVKAVGLDSFLARSLFFRRLDTDLAIRPREI